MEEDKQLPQGTRVRPTLRMAVGTAMAIFVAVSVVLYRPTTMTTPKLGAKSDVMSDGDKLAGDMLLEPERVFQEWKAQHSVNALRTDPYNRRFHLAEVSCPERAGNLLNYFTYDLVLAMLTNRTVLWRYHDGLRDNPEQACDEILRVAPWIPSYEEFWQEHGLPEEPTESVQGLRPDKWLQTYYDKHAQDDNSVQPLIPHTTKLVHITLLSKYFNTIHPEMWSHDLVLNDPLTRRAFSKMLDLDNDAHEIIPRLYDKGHAFLRGMLFNDAIFLKQHLIDSVQSYLQTTNNDDNDVTIGIHARHKKAEEDGSDITDQLNCLESMLLLLRKEDNRGETKNCTVFIMADRPKSLQALANVSFNLGCKPVVVKNVEHDLQDAKYRQKEHGAFSGQGFFRDFLVTSQARSGFIHSAGKQKGSSASALVWQEIIFRGIKDGTFDHAPPPDCSPYLGGIRLHDGFNS